MASVKRAVTAASVGNHPVQPGRILYLPTKKLSQNLEAGVLAWSANLA